VKVVQLTSSTFAVSLIEEEIELSRGRIVLDLPDPGGIVPFQNERGELRQFLRRQLANGALNFERLISWIENATCPGLVLASRMGMSPRNTPTKGHRIDNRRECAPGLAYF
jgi:hypothetical protein